MRKFPIYVCINHLISDLIKFSGSVATMGTFGLQQSYVCPISVQRGYSVFRRAGAVPPRSLFEAVWLSTVYSVPSYSPRQGCEEG